MNYRLSIASTGDISQPHKDEPILVTNVTTECDSWR
jgi:hypothetical protein